MVTSLICVSRRQVSTASPDVELADIVAAFQARCRLLDITGALVATSDYFAQILEGPDGAIDEMMRLVSGDIWHCDILVPSRKAIARRMFADWAMVYAGSATYVARAIAPFFTAQPELVQREAVQNLLWLILEFSQAAR